MKMEKVLSSRSPLIKPKKPPSRGSSFTKRILKAIRIKIPPRNTSKRAPVLMGPRMVAERLLPKNIPAMIRSMKKRIEPKKKDNNGKRGFFIGGKISSMFVKSKGLTAAPRAYGKMLAISDVNSDMIPVLIYVRR